MSKSSAYFKVQKMLSNVFCHVSCKTYIGLDIFTFNGFYYIHIKSGRSRGCVLSMYLLAYARYMHWRYKGRESSVSFRLRAWGYKHFPGTMTRNTLHCCFTNFLTPSSRNSQKYLSLIFKNSWLYVVSYNRNQALEFPDLTSFLSTLLYFMVRILLLG